MNEYLTGRTTLGKDYWLDHCTHNGVSTEGLCADFSDCYKSFKPLWEKDYSQELLTVASEPYKDYAPENMRARSMRVGPALIIGDCKVTPVHFQKENAISQEERNMFYEKIAGAIKKLPITDPKELTWHTECSRYYPNPPSDGKLLNEDVVIMSTNGHGETLQKTVMEAVEGGINTDGTVIKITFRRENLTRPEHKLKNDWRRIKRYYNKEEDIWHNIDYDERVYYAPDNPEPFVISDECVTLKDLIVAEMRSRGENWADIVAEAHCGSNIDNEMYVGEKWYNYPFLNNYNANCPWFCIQTENWVYFLVREQERQNVYVASVPRGDMAALGYVAEEPI